MGNDSLLNYKTVTAALYAITGPATDILGDFEYILYKSADDRNSDINYECGKKIDKMLDAIDESVVSAMEILYTIACMDDDELIQLLHVCPEWYRCIPNPSSEVTAWHTILTKV